MPDIEKSIIPMALPEECYTCLNNLKSFKEEWVDSTPTAMAMTDDQGKFTAVSGRWLFDFNLKRSNVIGKSFTDLFPELCEENEKIFKDCLNGGVNKASEVRFKRPDGSTIWLDWDIRPWHNLQNKFGGMIMLTQDVTGYKHSKEQLIQSEKHFRNAFEHSPIGMSIVNLDGSRIDVNKKLCEMLGYSKKELLSIGDSMISHPEDLLTERKLFQELYEGSIESFQTEKRYIHKNGSTVWVDLAVSVLTDSQNNPIQFIKQKTDITVKKLANEKLLVNLKEIQSKNDELHQFTHIASHDLREPLNTILSLIDLIEQDDQIFNESSLVHRLELIKASTNRMQTLIKELFQYSRLSVTEKFGRVDLNKVLMDVIADLSQLIELNDPYIEVGKLSKIRGSEIQLRILFQNLISNALKFQKNGVKPVIKIGMVEGKSNEFYISDNGIGIEEIYFEKVFQLFQRLHQREAYDGIGIGLSSCKKIVEQHKGKIWLESKPNAGTTFYFTLNA
ncbi:MAG: PAS domain S-box protein [Bacteroidota bacterium]